MKLLKLLVEISYEIYIVVVGLYKPTDPKLRVDLRFGFTTSDEGQREPKRSEEPNLGRRRHEFEKC